MNRVPCLPCIIQNCLWEASLTRTPEFLNTGPWFQWVGLCRASYTSKDTLPSSTHEELKARVLPSPLTSALPSTSSCCCTPPHLYPARELWAEGRQPCLFSISSAQGRPASVESKEVRDDLVFKWGLGKLEQGTLNTYVHLWLLPCQASKSCPAGLFS
jgi:hypothetical protein